jgi:hypothetical protein
LTLKRKRAEPNYNYTERGQWLSVDPLAAARPGLSPWNYCQNIELNESEIAFLLEVNEFNLETRYPDFKLDFYKKCTKQFSSDYILKIKEIYKCIAGQI